MSNDERRQVIALAATFTAEPLQQGLEYWAERLIIPAAARFAGYNQIFQELLNSEGLLGSNRDGLNVLLVRLSDWLKYTDSGSAVDASVTAGAEWQSVIERNARDLAAALKSAANRSATPHLLLFCPSGDEAAAEASAAVAERERFFKSKEEQIERELSQTSGLYVVKSVDVLRSYGGSQYYNAYLDAEAHIPYTPAFYAWLATIIARRFSAIKRIKPRKIIALDCDHTLWKGVCGEDGPWGIELDEGHRYLQEFMIGQREAGMLLCLCSKNNEEDVAEVFDSRKDMPLSSEHILASRLNWGQKSNNLRQIAQELNLGLDSFVFIDDSPVECAEVEANCPEVLTLNLPQDSREIAGFLDNIWELDHLKVTKEDKKRAEMYQQSSKREEVRRESLTFDEFINSLELEVTIRPIGEDEVRRASELTLRTNQFNASARRRGEAEVESILREGRFGSLVVDVKDRFGEYGIVGLMIYECLNGALRVETMLLSCRALGRGVERRMIAHLGRIARSRGLERLEVEFLPTGKNKPARDFLEEICSGPAQQNGDGFTYSLPAELAEGLGDAKGGMEIRASRLSAPDSARPADPPAGSNSTLWNEIASRLNNADTILKAIEAWAGQHPAFVRKSRGPLVKPRTRLEQFLATKWEEMFGVEIGVHDNFFDFGVDSIKAAGFLNKLQQELNEYLFIVALFDAPTIAELARYLSDSYPDAVKRVCGPDAIEELGLEGQPGKKPSRAPRVNSETIEELRRVIVPLPEYEQSAAPPKNPQAIFVLAPPRSGTTLLRVMLGGHPESFAPPEMQLLLFNSLLDRKRAFSGRNSFWLEGTIRALMEINGCDGDEAKALMEQYEQDGMSAKEFYALIQRSIGGKRLVDKTPSYAMDLQVLKRAERYFDNTLYIHLLRHPYAMIRSFEEARLDQIFRYDTRFKTRELAELIWTISHQNIIEFLKDIPPERQHRLSFEELVRQPETVIGTLCQFLGLDLHPNMLEPQQRRKGSMTDGLHGQSRMLGDVKFHSYKTIDPKVADRWRDERPEGALGKETWETAGLIGYERFDRNEDELKYEEADQAAKRSLDPIPVVASAGKRLPLSVGQERLWFLYQMEPDATAYTAILALQLKGSVNAARLKQSLNEIVRRHAILRTRFESKDGPPYQVVEDEVDLDLVIADLSALPPSIREAEAKRVAAEQSKKPFDLTQACLLRGTLITSGGLTDESGIFNLVLTLPHIIFDGWSHGVLLRELAGIYEQYTDGAPSPLAELSIQYADYASWQREILRAEAIEAHLSYWVEHLSGAPAMLELPTDRPRPPVRSDLGALQRIHLSAPAHPATQAAEQAI